ncbi:MAG: PAS domain-containing protein [Hydrogenophaga sp.]|nr:PAS domain-containing protein [Hydrogenophaga sp.]
MVAISPVPDISPDGPDRPACPGQPYEAAFLASPLPSSLSRQRDGRLVAVNDAWLKLTGSRREDVIGRTTVELGHWPDAQARHDFLKRVRAEVQHETIWLSRGVPHAVRMHATVLKVRPEPLLLVVLLDAHPQRTAEKKLAMTENAFLATHRALEQRVELHAALEKIARVGHWVNGASDQEVVWSEGLYAITGLEPGPVITRVQGRSAIHPDDMPGWLEARQACDGREFTFRWLHPDGHTRWFRTRISRTAVAGSPPTDFGVVQDITTEREASDALAAQLHFIHSIAARAPGLMYQARLRPDGTSTIPYVNEAVREMLELEPAALRDDARMLFQRVHPDDLEQLRANLAASAQGMTPWRQVYRVQLPTKGMRYYSVEALPEREPDGSILWHGFTTDVTAAKNAELVFERQDRMLEAVRQAQALFIEADDKRKAFEGLLDAFLAVTGSEYGFLGEILRDSAGQPYLKTHAITNIAWDEPTRRLYEEHHAEGMEFRNLKTLFGAVMVTGKPVLTNLPSTDARAGGLPAGHPHMSAFLGIPIHAGDQMVAMVGLANQPGGYAESDVEFLQPLVGTLRQLVMAWRGHAERRRTRRELEATSAQLAEKSAALQVALDSMNQGLTKIDADGRVRLYSRRLLELLDIPESLVADGATYEKLVAFQVDRGDFGDQLRLLEPHLRPVNGALPAASVPDTYWRRTRDGRTLEVNTRHFSEGGMVRTFTDVTPYIQAQEALRDERQRLTWVLDATRPGIWETNVVTQEMKINERWAEMLGYTLAELQPTTVDTWRHFVYSPDMQRAQCILQKHLSGEIDFYECDLRLRHKAGHWVWINDRGRVHQRDAEGRPLFMSGTHLDISERVAAQEQVRALNASLEARVAARTAELEGTLKDMEAISYSIAHDLRAPLRSVNGFAALIAEEEAERLSENGRDMFGRITRSSRNMGQMITDMLELLRVVRVELDAVPVDMQLLAETAVEAIGASAEQARLELAPMPLALGDATLLRQVLINLMDNALKYSRHQPQPVLHLGFDSTLHAYYLRDNGMGFDMSRAGKLFGLFQRLHVGSDVPGTGVGLAIVARIIERHGGRIWAESAPGQGATFWWTLPHA